MTHKNDTADTGVNAARDWVKILSAYREPDALRSSFELAVTVGAFLLLWTVAWYAMSISPLLAFAHHSA